MVVLVLIPVLPYKIKITSLTFLFTDLKGSTALYERVGDLVAYDLVRQHFGVLHEIVAVGAGCGRQDDCALAAALRMREAMTRINADRGNEDLLLKIGIRSTPQQQSGLFRYRFGLTF